MYIPTYNEFEAREGRINDLENLSIELLMKVQKEHNLSGKIMDDLSYDVDFEMTPEEHNSKASMMGLIRYLLKENYNITI